MLVASTSLARLDASLLKHMRCEISTGLLVVAWLNGMPHAGLKGPKLFHQRGAIAGIFDQQVLGALFSDESIDQLLKGGKEQFLTMPIDQEVVGVPASSATP